jgi:hypothetical protein
MAMVDGDWTIDAANGNIRYIGGDHGASPTYATVIEFHRWLQDFADQAEWTGDDEMDITVNTPSERSTDNIIKLINGFNITATEAEHLYDGSITQGAGPTEEIWDGIVNFGNSNVQIQIIQDGALALAGDDFWNQAGAGLNADAAQGISHRFMIKVRDNGVDIDGRRLVGTTRTFLNTYGEFKINGTSRGNNVLALSDSDDLNNETAAATVATWTTITNTEGLRLIDINNDTTNEEYYSEWNRATFTINQFYERMKWLTRDGSVSTINGLNGEVFRGITHSFAYDAEAGVAPATNDDLAWGTAIAYDNETVAAFQVGEAIHEDTATPVWKGRVIAVDDNGTTGTLIVDVEEGTVLDPSSFTGQTSGAKADVNVTPTAVSGGGLVRVFAIDDDGTTGFLYVQVLKGPAPVNNVILYDDLNVANTVTVNGALTERAISTPFVGASTGSALIGSYGLGMEAADTSASDTFFDLKDTGPIFPPNNVTFQVFGLEVGEDRILVTNNNASAIDFAQLTLNTTLSGATETAVVTTVAIPTDTPSTGTIRVEMDDGRYRLLSYTSFSGSTFTIPSTSFSGDAATQPKNVFISYLDKLAASATESFSYVYNADRTHFVRARDGGAASPIKTFETTGVMGSTGGSSTVIRTPDV